MEKPKRIQLKRSKGWKLPANTVVVSRPSKWGNSASVAWAKKLHPSWTWAQLHEWAVREYECQCESEAMRRMIRRELRGKDLACWCKPELACHSEVLLRIANEKEGK